MNTKAKGSRNERRSMELFEAEGYAMTRAAASLGLWDLVGVGPRGVVLVQVKSNEWPRSDEMAALRGFKAPPCARLLVHRWRDREKEPDVRTLQDGAGHYDDDERF